MKCLMDGGKGKEEPPPPQPCSFETLQGSAWELGLGASLTGDTALVLGGRSGLSLGSGHSGFITLVLTATFTPRPLRARGSTCFTPSS